MYPKKVSIYDTTLRDGTQAEGISFSVQDKIRIAEKLDAFGIQYIEGGWPGSNPKDIEFFAEAKKRPWKTARLCAFGSTCRANLRPEEDTQVALLLEAETPVVTIVGKSWRFHVEEILGVTVEENLRMIRETVAYLKAYGREVIFDAEHFFDGYKDEAAHALKSIQSAAESGADLVVLCDTNGGTLPHEIERITRSMVEALSVPVGIHTHNDCELGVANALAGLQAGPVQAQGTVNRDGDENRKPTLTSHIPIWPSHLAPTHSPTLRLLPHISHP